ncbi:MAG: hypothetical protein ABFC84_07190 [Veillonellales bacterium]
MVTIDVVGLLLTICLTGLRYPHFVMIAALIQEAGEVLMTIFMHGQINSLVAAGAFGMAAVMSPDGVMIGQLIVLGGTLANFIVSSISGGVELEKAKDVLNPLSVLQYPFAVVNLRVAVISFTVNAWYFFSSGGVG